MCISINCFLVRQGRHMCPFCEYIGLDLQLYQQHLLRHISHETLTCPHCGFATGRKDAYAFHMDYEHGVLMLQNRTEVISEINIGIFITFPKVKTFFIYFLLFKC